MQKGYQKYFRERALYYTTYPINKQGRKARDENEAERKQVCELSTDFEKWVYLLKNMHKLKEIPPEFADSMFARLFLLAEIGKFTPEEQEHYYKSLENMGDYYNIIHTAEEIAENRGIEKGRAEGRAEGLVKGRAEGERKKQIEVARNLKALGVDIDTIVKASGLDRETVESL